MLFATSHCPCSFLPVFATEDVKYCLVVLICTEKIYPQTRTISKWTNHNNCFSQMLDLLKDRIWNPHRRETCRVYRLWTKPAKNQTHVNLLVLTWCNIDLCSLTFLSVSLSLFYSASLKSLYVGWTLMIAWHEDAVYAISRGCDSCWLLLAALQSAIKAFLAGWPK